MDSGGGCGNDLGRVKGCVDLADAVAAVGVVVVEGGLTEVMARDRGCGRCARRWRGREARKSVVRRGMWARVRESGVESIKDKDMAVIFEGRRM